MNGLAGAAAPAPASFEPPAKQIPRRRTAGIILLATRLKSHSRLRDGRRKSKKPIPWGVPASIHTPEIRELHPSIQITVCEASGQCSIGPKRASRRKTRRRVNQRGPNKNPLPPGEVISPVERPDRDTRLGHPASRQARRQNHPRAASNSPNPSSSHATFLTRSPLFLV